MSKAFKCDRCGLLYENDMNERYVKTNLYLSTYQLNIQKDLCPACYRSLAKWYENTVLYRSKKDIDKEDLSKKLYKNWDDLKKNIIEYWKTHDLESYNLYLDKGENLDKNRYEVAYSCKDLLELMDKIEENM